MMNKRWKPQVWRGPHSPAPGMDHFRQANGLKIEFKSEEEAQAFAEFVVTLGQNGLWYTDWWQEKGARLSIVEVNPSIHQPMASGVPLDADSYVVDISLHFEKEEK